jgi:hypothetical protein
MSMSTQVKLSRSRLFERTTPAKLSRSTIFVWVLLCLAGCAIGFSYDWHNRLLQNLAIHTVPTEIAGHELSADFAGMAYDAQLEALAGDTDQTSKVRADYTLWHNKATRDLDAVSRLPPAVDPWYVFPDKVVAADSKLVLEMAPLLYEHDQALAEARQLLAAGQSGAADKPFRSASEILTKLKVTSDLLISNSSSAYYAALGSYVPWHQRLVTANYAAAAIVLAFLAWQYLFILIKCRVVIQSTLVSLLLCAFAFGYTDLGYRVAEHHLYAAEFEMIPTNLATVPEQRAATDWTAQIKSSQAAAATATAFQGQASKAEGHIRYLLVALVALLLAGQTYKLAVLRAKRFYG